jgi:hypothetical protein
LHVAADPGRSAAGIISMVATVALDYPEDLLERFDFVIPTSQG